VAGAIVVDPARHLVGCDTLLDSSSDEILKFFVTHLNDASRKPSKTLGAYFASNDSHKTPFLLQHPLAHHRSKHQSGWLESCSRRRIEAPPKEQRVRVRLPPRRFCARIFDNAAAVEPRQV
jgi:hypothetical protein